MVSVTPTPTDHDLVNRAQEGERGAFVELYDRYKGRIMRYAYHTIGDYQLAEEVTQETFLNAHRHIRRYRPTGSFSAWLYRIASNQSRNTLRKMRRSGYFKGISVTGEEEREREIWDVIENHSTRPDYAVQRKELQAKIRETLKALKTPFREILILRDIEGLSYKEVARIAGCSEGTVASRLSRAREEFRKLIRTGYLKTTEHWS